QRAAVAARDGVGGAAPGPKGGLVDAVESEDLQRRLPVAALALVEARSNLAEHVGVLADRHRRVVVRARQPEILFQEVGRRGRRRPGAGERCRSECCRERETGGSAHRVTSPRSHGSNGAAPGPGWSSETRRAQAIPAGGVAFRQRGWAWEVTCASAATRSRICGGTGWTWRGAKKTLPRVERGGKV